MIKLNKNKATKIRKYRRLKRKANGLKRQRKILKFLFTKIISNGKYYGTDQLNVENISEGFIIYEKFNL